VITNNAHLPERFRYRSRTFMSPRAVAPLIVRSELLQFGPPVRSRSDLQMRLEALFALFPDKDWNFGFVAHFVSVAELSGSGSGIGDIRIPVAMLLPNSHPPAQLATRVTEEIADVLAAASRETFTGGRINRLELNMSLFDTRDHGRKGPPRALGAQLHKLHLAVEDWESMQNPGVVG